MVSVFGLKKKKTGISWHKNVPHIIDANHLLVATMDN